MAKAKSKSRLRTALKIDVDSTAGKLKYGTAYRDHVESAMTAGEKPLSRKEWEKKQKAK